MSATVGITIATSMAIATGNKYWFDYYHLYYLFGPEYTSRIDQILLNPHHGKIGPSLFLSPGVYIPACGIHRYFVDRTSAYKSWKSFQRYVGLEKIKMEKMEQYYYLAWISPLKYGKQALQDLENKIKDETSISTLTFHNQIPITVFKTCHSPWPSQELILDAILNQWIEERDYNLKVLILGPSGCGKSYVGRLLKKKLNHYVHLYEDLDPTLSDFNISMSILNHAAPTTPIILMINDIDLLYQRVFQNLPGVRTETGMFNLMDTIASTPHVITIFTAKKWKKEFESLFRPGRLDLIADMETQSVRTNN